MKALVCTCGHVRASHADRCACGCDRYRPAYPVWEHDLPAGVRVIRSQRIQSGLTLVSCAHDAENRRRSDGSFDPRCHVCKADAISTAGFVWPVSKLAVVGDELLRPREVQEALF